MPTFGEVISQKRKESGLSQKELAAMVVKEDGQAISPQYLNDLEHNRRNPPSAHLIEEFAKVLKVEADVLHHYAGDVPPDIQAVATDEAQLVKAYKEFRRVIQSED